MDIGGRIGYVASARVTRVKGGINVGDGAEAIPTGVAIIPTPIPGVVMQGHHPAVVDGAIARAVWICGGTVVAIDKDVLGRYPAGAGCAETTVVGAEVVEVVGGQTDDVSVDCHAAVFNGETHVMNRLHVGRNLRCGF